MILICITLCLWVFVSDVMCYAALLFGNILSGANSMGPSVWYLLFFFCFCVFAAMLRSPIRKMTAAISCHRPGSPSLVRQTLQALTTLALVVEVRHSSKSCNGSMWSKILRDFDFVLLVVAI